jgi:hypothetical protein
MCPLYLLKCTHDFSGLLKIYLAKWYEEPYNFDMENEPGQDFASVCNRALGFYDALTRSHFGIRVDDSLGPMGDIMSGVADMAAKEIRLRMIGAWLRQIMH